MPDSSPLPGRPASSTSAGLGLFGHHDLPDAPSRCSRKGCGDEAAWLLRWNNPRIHAPERRKTWASCQDHVEWFEQYLGDRGLWKETVPLHPTPDDSVTENS